MVEIEEMTAPALASVPSAYDARWGDRSFLARVPDVAKRRLPPESFLARPVLLLCGDTGAGKSSLAAALFCLLVGSVGPDAEQEEIDFAARGRWVEARDVPGEGAAVAWRSSLVVIDDVGQEGGAGESFAAQDRLLAMANLLDRLYTHRVFGQNRARIIITTYGTETTWAKWYGAGVMRRYWEDRDHVLKVKLERT